LYCIFFSEPVSYTEPLTEGNIDGNTQSRNKKMLVAFVGPVDGKLCCKMLQKMEARRERSNLISVFSKWLLLTELIELRCVTATKFGT
jgi:hypothetical protein